MRVDRKIAAAVSAVLIVVSGGLLLKEDVPGAETSGRKRGKEGKKMTFKLESPEFKDGEMIPSRFTCQDRDASPKLVWSGVPDGTQSFALINDDPDAPVGTWVHWVIYDLPENARELPEGVSPKEARLKTGAKQGLNGWKRIGYGGPCPPSGTHRYFFKLYALTKTLELAPGATKQEVEKAMEGHILGEAKLMGRYKKT